MTFSEKLIRLRKREGLSQEALAEILSLVCPVLPLNVNKSSSVSGWAILLMRQSLIVLFKSYIKFEITIPSKAILLPPGNLPPCDIQVGYFSKKYNLFGY